MGGVSRIPASKLAAEFPRPNRFSADERARARVKHDDYTGSGYDRGHMAPNYAIASRFGETAQTETILMSNMVPQLPALNQGAWRLLEEELAELTVPANEEIWGIVGLIYAKGSSPNLPGGPAVPSAFYALVADETSGGPRMQAFIIPKWVDRRANFRDFMTSVDEVQRRTGLDFFGSCRTNSNSSWNTLVDRTGWKTSPRTTGPTWPLGLMFNQRRLPHRVW